MSGTACSSALALIVVAAMSPWNAEAGEPMHKREERTLLEKSHAVYDLFRDGEKVGAQSVTREVFDDNTIVFTATIDLQLSNEVMIVQEIELVLEEESHFPRSYRMNKKTRHAQTVIDQRFNVEMFANVARVEKEVNGEVETHNLVLPTGTPLVESSVIHPVHQLLFWYNHERGGRQAFRVFEIDHNASSEVVLERLERQTVALDGEELEVNAFDLDWRTHKARYYVDDEGRIVAADMGFMRAELSEWTVQKSDDKG